MKFRDIIGKTNLRLKFLEIPSFKTINRKVGNKE